MTTLEILRAAREHLSNPENWCKGLGDGSPSPRCVEVALMHAGDHRHVASGALSLVRPSSYQSNVEWNDDPETTHADVLAALDAAIEAQS